MKHHDLKTWPAPFADGVAGRKPWEFRFNDRDFKVGETITRREYDPKTMSYTGRAMGTEKIVYILADGFGIPKNYVIMSLAPCVEEPPK